MSGLPPRERLLRVLFDANENEWVGVESLARRAFCHLDETVLLINGLEREHLLTRSKDESMPPAVRLRRSMLVADRPWTGHYSPVRLPQETLLGHLRMIEVLDYWDFPRLFVAKNASGHRYVGFCSILVKGERIWLYVGASPGRLTALREGEIDIRDVFEQAEDGFVHEIRTARTSLNLTELRCITAASWPARGIFLPPVGDRLGPDVAPPLALSAVAAQAVAIASAAAQDPITHLGPGGQK